MARTVTGSTGLAVLTLRERSLRLGENPIVARFYPDDSRYLGSVSAHTVARVKPRVPVTVGLTTVIEPKRGDLIARVQLTRKIDGYGIRGRLIELRVAGKPVTTARTDRHGRAVIVLRGRDLPVGTSGVMADSHSGSSRFTKARSRTVLVDVTSGHRVSKVEAVR
jgi:hypothetical protein